MKSTFARQLNSRSAQALTLALALSTGASAANDRQSGITSVPRLSAEMAQQAVTAAVLACRKEGWKVTASVVNPDGVLQAALRDDGAGPHTVSFSYRKAYSAASYMVDTLKLDQEVQRTPDIQSLRGAYETLVLGGGIPIRNGAQLIAAIGVSGTPSATVDDRCAQAGIAAIDSALR
ncbi:TPA: heme-binding protein [Pseudomonas aeruginosa]